MVRDFSWQIFCNAACSSSCALVVLNSFEIYTFIYTCVRMTDESKMSTKTHRLLRAHRELAVCEPLVDTPERALEGASAQERHLHLLGPRGVLLRHLVEQLPDLVELVLERVHRVGAEHCRALVATSGLNNNKYRL
jgi:hypothetical protein